MKSKLVYVELKTGYNDNGPAWIGKAFFSRTGRTIYFNGLAFSKQSRGGGNHYEILSGDYYWVSGIKKTGSNRHWAGHGKIQIDENVVTEYLAITNQSLPLSNTFEVVELNNNPAVEKYNAVLNETLD
ncbi:MAG TPA: hypothetical protein VIM89_00180 [Mucilaginibacter sp.]